MAFSERYQQQVDLLVRCLPAVAAEGCFALKGGTAINLFVRDMPRLSVDIDLTFLPIMPRAESLAAIESALLRIAERLRSTLRDARIAEGRLKENGTLTRLAVRESLVEIKIEVTPVLRGCVFAPTTMVTSPRVQDEFAFAEIPVVSFADLYAGKIMAALDRQHPRDLFDVRGLLAHEGISDELRQAIIVYLISHDRPIAEVLSPRRRTITAEYAEAFTGMTDEPVTLNELLEAREDLIAAVLGGMPAPHRRFLLGFKSGEPDWDLLGVPHASDLPAVRWKQMNLDKLAAEARTRLVAALATTLGEA